MKKTIVLVCSGTINPSLAFLAGVILVQGGFKKADNFAIVNVDSTDETIINRLDGLSDDCEILNLDQLVLKNQLATKDLIGYLYTNFVDRTTIAPWVGTILNQFEARFAEFDTDWTPEAISEVMKKTVSWLENFSFGTFTFIDELPVTKEIYIFITTAVLEGQLAEAVDGPWGKTTTFGTVSVTRAEEPSQGDESFMVVDVTSPISREIVVAVAKAIIEEDTLTVTTISDVENVRETGFVLQIAKTPEGLDVDGALNRVYSIFDEGIENGGNITRTSNGIDITGRFVKRENVTALVTKALRTLVGTLA